MPSLRRKNLIVSKRRVDDEGEEDGGPDALLDGDDSLSEGSISDDDLADFSSQAGSASPELRRVETNGKSVGDGGANSARHQENKSQTLVVNGNSDTDLMLNGLKSSDQEGTVDVVNYDDIQKSNGNAAAATIQSPAIVGSKAQMDQLAAETPIDRRRREHDDYKQKRDADPAFVPNRGAFFMHDHRHAGPAANGFRPFGRGRGRGRGIRGPFAPMQ